MVSHILAAWYHLGQDSVSGASNHLMAMGLIVDHREGYPPTNFDTQKPDGSGPRNLRVNVRNWNTLRSCVR